MKNKFATRVAAGVLTFAMVATTVVGEYSDVYAATKTGAVKKVATVSTQKKLNAALKKDHVKHVIIKTKKAVGFKISSVSYYRKKLTVNAPKSIVVNYGDFKKVYVKDAKKYIEKGESNDLLIKDSNKLILTVPKNVYTNSVNLAGAGGKITLNGAGTLDTLIITNYTKLTIAKNITIHKLIVLSDADLKINGAVNEISVENAGTVLKITGNTTVTPMITVNGENSVIESDVKVDVKANADIEVKLDEGAKGSTVDAAKGVETKIDNQTGEEVKISKSESTDKKDSTSSSGTSAAEKKKEKQTAPTFSDASLTFDSPNEATVTFDKRKDLGKLEFAIYKNGNETELATDMANTDEEAAGTQVTIATDGVEPEKTYVVKARYTATNNADASDWANVATGTAPEWVAQASLSSTKATISLGETATLPSVVSGYVNNQGEDKREIRINKWVLKSKPENASDSSYDKAGKYVWEPELITGYKFLDCTPEYTVTVTKATQEAPAALADANITFDSASKATVTFDSRTDLDKLEFAIFKSKDENALATYTATADEVTAGTQVTINLKEQLNAETEYVVKARYAETENLEASEWVKVAEATTPKWITEAVLSSSAETIDLRGTATMPTLTASASALKVDTTGVIWVLKSKPEGASDSFYDVKGQYVWEPEVAGYGFEEGAPQYTVTVKGKYTVDGKNVTGTADASEKTLSFDVAEDLQNGYSFKIVYNDNTIEGKIDNGKVNFNLGDKWAYNMTYTVQYCRNEDEENYASEWAIYGSVKTQELITKFIFIQSLDVEENPCTLDETVKAMIGGQTEEVPVVAWTTKTKGVTINGFRLTFGDGVSSCNLQATIDTSKYALKTGVELPSISASYLKQTNQ